MKKFEVLGLMSGTSLDGLDLAYVQFEKNNGWKFQIVACKAVPFDYGMQTQLASAHKSNALKLKQLDLLFGKWLGKKANCFLEEIGRKPDMVASHGHTIFHQPEEGLTLQIGNGYEIMLATGLPCICDLRSLDVALGGQGAPLVPVGDKLLFDEYAYCLNLGGFSNISYDYNGQRIAYDICPVNTVLNALARELKLPYDKNGAIARKGKTNLTLMKKLNSLAYYRATPPKSLGIEWVEENITPLLQGYDPADLLSTFTDHVAFQISAAVFSTRTKYSAKEDKLLITGGGAHNGYLIDCLRKNVVEGVDIVLPEQNIIEFKEAVIFAFLGLRRLLKENNTWKSVTGAKRDSCGGILFHPDVL